MEHIQPRFIQKKNRVQKPWFYSLHLSNAELPGKIGWGRILLNFNPFKTELSIVSVYMQNGVKMQNTQEDSI